MHHLQHSLMMFDCSRRGRCSKYFGDVHSCTHRWCSFAIAISRPRWHRRPTRTVHSTWFGAAVSACADQQFGTNFHSICEARTPRNSLNVVLMAVYLSVRTARGASDRHRLKVRLTITYLLIFF